MRCRSFRSQFEKVVHASLQLVPLMFFTSFLDCLGKVVIIRDRMASLVRSYEL